ncbi:UNVERIFIED_CONTAM: Retrovirus-related Pol polyprotein from transposon RE1 [Sesamum calycinum]|uniref:Retrovirus-related Pol polyprotein from transposon RE1 n=1 Tax=Sesamum calycinum TaxID=2727403 RepID=A0AAW2N2C5_9LAMI
MCNDLHAFTFLQNSSTVSSIFLPNGTKTQVLQSGHISLSQNLILKETLYVPTFQSNLLSEPRSYAQTQGKLEWEQAMDDEIHALETNKTWSMTTLPPGKKVIDSKWVFKLILNPDVHQLDVNNAFLHGHLDEEVHMTPPEGISSDGFLALLVYGRERRKLRLHLTTYTDADWGSCVESRCSITSYCILLGSSLISWKTKKQNTVSRSSAEAEYRAMSAIVCELQWITYLLKDFQLPISTAIPFWCDNQAAIHITANPMFHERTKHLDIDCHIVRDKYKEGFIRPSYISSKLQVADIFMKSLPCASFLHLLPKLGFSRSLAQLEGRCED